MSWTIRSVQNKNTLTHYGVLGMKWGVRKEDKPRSIVGKGTINRNQKTSSTKVIKNSNGSVTVTGMKNIRSATFDSEEIYNDWVNGRNNPFAIEFDTYARNSFSIGGTSISTKLELVNDGPGSAYGVGYVLNFENARQLETYQQTVQKNAESYYTQKAVSKHESEINEIQTYVDKYGENVLNRSDISAKVSALEESIGREICNQYANGYRELREYQYTQIASEYGQETVDSVMEQLRDEIEAMGYDYDELKKLSDAEKKTSSTISKIGTEKISSSSVKASGKIGKKKTESVMNKIGKVTSSFVKSLGDIAKKADKSAKSFFSGLFKRK